MKHIKLHGLRNERNNSDSVCEIRSLHDQILDTWDNELAIVPHYTEYEGLKVTAPGIWLKTS